MQAEDKYRSIFENAVEGIYQSTSEGKFIAVNPAMARILGYGSPEDLLANLTDIDTQYYAVAGYQAEYKRLMESQGFVRDFETLAARKDGSTVWVSINARAVRDSKSELLYDEGFVTDISRRKLSEETLHLNLKAAERLGQEASVMAEISRIIGSTLNINEVYEKFAETVKKLISFDRIVITVINHGAGTICNAYVSGIEVADLPLGNTVPLAGSVSEEIVRIRKGLLIQGENRREFADRFPAILNTFQAGLRSMLSVPLFSRDQVIGVLHLRSLSRNAYMEADLNLAQRIGDQIAGAVANAQLFNDFKMTTEALRENEERYRALFDGSLECVYIHDVEGNFTDANCAALKLLGYEREEIRSVNLASLARDGQLSKALKALAELKETGKQKEVTEFKLVRKDGGYIDVETMGSVIYRDGKQYAIQGIARDISDRKKKEAALKKSEERFSKAFQASPAAITISSQNDGRYIDVNESFVRISGFTRQEAIGRSGLELGIWDRNVRRRFMEIFETEGRMRDQEFQFRDKSGKLRTCLLSAEIIELDGKSCVISVAEDITERKRAEEALRKSEKEYRSVIENIQDVFYRSDVNGRLVMGSPSGVKMFGYNSMEEMIGLPLESFWADLRDRERLFARMKESGSVRGIEAVLKRKDGTTLDATFDTHFYYDDRGILLGTEGMIRDITERKRAEKALKEKTDELDRFFSLALDLLCIADRDGYFRRLNRAWENTLGYPIEELEGRKFLDFVHPDDIPATLEAAVKLSGGKGIVDFTNRYRRRDGSFRWIEWRSAPYQDKLIYAAARDITERKQMEEALRASEERWQFALEGPGDGVWDWNAETNKVFFSCQWKAMLGFADHEIGDNLVEWDKRVHPDDYQRVYAEIDKHFKGESPVYVSEHRLLCKDGSYKWILDRGKVVTWTKENKPLRIIGTHTDITERKRAEEALQRSEREAQTLLQETKIMAEIGRIISSSLNIEEVYERFAAEVKKLIPFERISINEVNPREGKGSAIYISGLEVPARKWGGSFPLAGSVSGWLLENRSGLLVQGERIGEFLKRTPAYLPVYQAGIRSLIAIPLISRDEAVGNLIIASVKPDSYSEHDLELAGKIGNQIAGAIANAKLFQDNKKTGEELRESEERYRRLVENAPLGIISVDGEGNIKQVNSRLVSILGSPSAEATQSINLFTFTPLMEAGISGNLRRCLESGKSAVFETAYHSKWGKDSYLRYHLTPSWNGEGKISGAEAIVEDISERKNLEGQLLQAQKMEAIGTLAGGIAHDFNNILTAILGYTELAIGELSEEDSTLKYKLQQTIQAGYRAKDLVRQILTFSRQGKQERKPMDIRPIIKESLKLLRASLPATIEIRQDFEEGDLGIIEADPTQIHQIMMNLSTNAAHAMSERGGVLTVSLSKVDLVGGCPVAYGGIRPNRYLRLRVSDTGHGMTPEIMKRVFDPYFTTKEIGKGTGLGLAVVHGIVKSYGGEIEVSSEPEKGTTLDIFFPRTDSAKIVFDSSQNASLPRGNERILFVDDEKAIVEITQNMLQRLGYEVVVRTSSIEALELFRGQPDRFDLAITDMTMPNMTGDKLALELMKIRPEIPVILVTGFSEKMSEEKAKALGIREYLMKPPVTREFAKAIRRALGKDPEIRFQP